jgi:hypothetical protein
MEKIFIDDLEISNIMIIDENCLYKCKIDYILNNPENNSDDGDNSDDETINFQGKKRYDAICEHVKLKRNCIECYKNGIGGSSFCEHEVRRYTCKKCYENGTGGNGICIHLNVKQFCKICYKHRRGGASLCKHLKSKHLCSKCNDLFIVSKNRISKKTKMSH